MSSAKLTAREKYGYGIGDFGFNLFFSTASLYLLFYYTDVMGLSPAVGGWVFAAALIWDAFFDPFMGYLLARTKTRWGRYRPYLLFGAVPLAASWVLIFTPTSLTGLPLILFALAAHMLFRTFYAMVNVPYLSLVATMTKDSNERGSIASIRMFSAATCGLVVAIGTQKLVEAFGGGSTGFLWTAVLYGALATVILFIVFANTQEREEDDATAHVPNLRDMMTMVRSNRAFWIVALALLCGSIGSTMFGKTLPYYLKYAMGAEDKIGTALAMMTGGVLLAIPFWAFVMKRTSKRTMWMSGLSLAICVYPLLWVLADQPAVWIMVLALSGFAAGAGYLGFWSMVPDTVEDGEWRTGVRAEGAVFGLILFIQKAALGLAAALLGEILSIVGFKPNVVQSPEVLSGLKVVLLGLPWVCAIVTLLIILFYPIDTALHERLKRATEWRRQRRAQRLARA